MYAIPSAAFISLNRENQFWMPFAKSASVLSCVRRKPPSPLVTILEPERETTRFTVSPYHFVPSDCAESIHPSIAGGSKSSGKVLPNVSTATATVSSSHEAFEKSANHVSLSMSTNRMSNPLQRNGTYVESQVNAGAMSFLFPRFRYQRESAMIAVVQEPKGIAYS